MMLWKQLAESIEQMSDEQKNQPVQAFLPHPNGDIAIGLMPGIAINTVDEFQIHACRSVVDNTRRGDDFVLLLDVCPFGVEGNTTCTWNDDGSFSPVFGPDGPTDPKLQRKVYDDPVMDWPGWLAEQLNYRVDVYESSKSEGL